MVTNTDLGVVSSVVHLHRFTLIAQVDRAFVADVVDLAAVPHYFHIVQIANHVQRAFVRFDQYSVLVPDDVQIVLVGIDPDTFLVPEKVLRFTNWYDHFFFFFSNDLSNTSDLIRASIASDDAARNDGRHISRGCTYDVAREALSSRWERLAAASERVVR